MSSRQPRVTGISPLQGTPGTKITVRGENLGRNVTDLISISICGVDCTLSAEWVSPSKITARPALVEDEGDIVVTTKSGGQGISLVKFLCQVQDKIGLLDDSGIFLDEDEANSTQVEVDVLNIITDSFPTLPNMCNVNLSEFNPEEYISQIYSAVSFDSLKTGLQTLKTHIRPRDQQPLELLKKNLSLHFDCYRRLDEMRRSLDKDEICGINSFGLNKLNESVSKCFSALLFRHDQVDRNRQLITHFNRWRNLFTLPSSLERNIARGNYQEAIDDFESAMESENCVGGMPTVLELIYAQSERQISKLKTRLKESLMEDEGMTLREQSHALMIAQDTQLVREFMGAQFAKIRDKLTRQGHSDHINALQEISGDMSKLVPDFASLCYFCKSMGLGDSIEELTDGLNSSLVKLYVKVIKGLLPAIEQINQLDKLDNLELALRSHRRCALMVLTGNERQTLARLSRTTRLACLNVYFNCCYMEIDALCTSYLGTCDVMNDWFPAQFYDIIQSYVERMSQHVTIQIKGELDFFDCPSSAIIFSKRFSQVIGVYSRGLKTFLREEADWGSIWQKLAVFLVDAESFVDIIAKKLSLTLQAHNFPKVENQIADFVKSCLRRQDDLFKRLVKLKCQCTICPNDSLSLSGINSHVYSMMNNIVKLCSQMGLISTSLLKRVLRSMCDDYLEKFLSREIGSLLSVTDLLALKVLCTGVSSPHHEEILEREIFAREVVGADEILGGIKKRFSIQLQAIAYVIS